MAGLWQACLRHFKKKSNPVASLAVISVDVEPFESRLLLSATLIKDISPGLDNSYPYNMVAIGDTLYFAAEDSIHGRELWRSGGTAKSTRLVSDVVPHGTWQPTDFINFEGVLFFTATTSATGRELWRSDGTAAGTYLVKDVNPGPTDSDIAEMTVVGDQLFFTAIDPKNGVELWRTNGKSRGTYLVKDINTQPSVAGSTEGSDPTGLVNWNGTLFFKASDHDARPASIYKSDGTAARTMRSAVTYYPTPDTLFLDRRKHVFLAFSNNGFLYKTDGYTADSVMVKQVELYTQEPRPSAIAGGVLFFSGSADGEGSGYLWRTDGTTKGTYRIKPISPTDLTAMGSRVIFGAIGGTVHSNQTLWVTDGTSTGTKMVQGPSDISNTFGGEIQEITPVGKVAFYTQGAVLHEVNSTLTKTAIVRDPANYGDPRSLTYFAGMLFFAAYGTKSGVELFGCRPDE